MLIQIVEKKDKDYSVIQGIYNMVQNKMPFLSEISDLKNALTGEVVYEAIADGETIAFISLWEPDNFIHYLFVNPLYQSKGIGLQLIAHLSEVYGKPLGLKCLLENTDAVRFYKKNGFYEKYLGTSAEGEYIYFELQ
ncbi:GNAT family N-acetyltransferase [Elizabethkingia sp. HX XZB]|uniref:GNAT family N-acetyltransferase n=1 Tax=Elizabethkingia sp. HX XZB TaxID=3003193 RepID=UPI002A23AB98|nr:GNAT family N-acetyltransferase [Elizabethkingia sp. HX XZB]MDX8566573.1 GNAT family N-acetyltransferase [Elizabethkingia sp. HX XZB]